jgi:hypothetical protein
MTVPQPAPQLRKLDYFTGTWRLEGEVKPGPLGPGGKLTETDRNHWMQGGFFLVVRSEFTISSVGSGTGVAYMGYDSYENVYTYDEFNSMGDAIHSKGTFNRDTWTWSGERKTQSGIAKTRWIVKIVSASSYDFTFETSSDGNTWNTVMAGKATKE